MDKNYRDYSIASVTTFELLGNAFVNQIEQSIESLLLEDASWASYIILQNLVIFY